MTNRFDLEQKIMHCWNVVDDIDDLYTAVCGQELTPDKIANVLLGMRDLYQIKFDSMFSTFETLIRDRKIS